MTRRVRWTPTPLTPPPPSSDLISLTLEFWMIILPPWANLSTLLSTLSCTLCNPCSIVSQLHLFRQVSHSACLQNLPYRNLSSVRATTPCNPLVEAAYSPPRTGCACVLWSPFQLLLLHYPRYLCSSSTSSTWKSLHSIHSFPAFLFSYQSFSYPI